MLRLCPINNLTNLRHSAEFAKLVDMFTKKYLRNTLLCTDYELNSRLSVLSELYKSGPYFPKIEADYDSTHVYIKLSRVNRLLTSYNELNPEWFRDVRNVLKANSAWHGDIKPQNIGFIGKIAVLIDWEPALKQLKNRTPQLMTSYNASKYAKIEEIHAADLNKLLYLEQKYGY